MKLSFRKGERGFTLIEIMIVLAVLAILAAVVVPNVAGFVSRGKQRAWAADRDILQAAVDSWRTDISKRSGNKWPVTDNVTVGEPTTSGADITDDEGMIDIAKLSSEGYIKGADSVKSANTTHHTTATNSVSGSYVWYIDSNGEVHSIYYDGSAWQDDFQTDIYP
ncbi:MAG: prepilin-type N-terminal cleavage/methylation domain-containing protein [Chloroflexi bacterium]|nr:prepilin-type N-terminal cleavage/methylation domain-containing protein [Chloroflexota bacterium]